MARNTKETLYFDREWRRGESWYRDFFSHCDRAKARGEVCNTYLYDASVPARIKSIIPNVILIACLRNPYDRLRSAYQYRIRAGEAAGSFEDVVRAQTALVSQGQYARNLNQYYRYFPAEQIKLFFYDDLQIDPYEFLRNLYSIIGVDSDFVPEQAEKSVNPSAEPRFPGTAKLMGGAARLLRKVGAHNILDRLKRSARIRNTLLVPTRNPDLTISESLRGELRHTYTPDIEQIETLTGRDLRQWKNF
jgi:hypothetical protein